MKKFIKILLPLLSVLLVFGNAGIALAADADGYSIVITKYKVNDKSELESIVPNDGTKAKEVKGTDGKSLATVAGISYEITRVTPIDGSTNFQPVQGVDAFTQTITTDNSGIAQITGLAAGTYRVTEKNNDQLKEVMEPVILELPLPQRSGPALDEVYLYPKSGVTNPNLPPDTHNPPPDNPPKIPKTSGNIGNYQPFILIFGFLMVAGTTGFHLMRRRKNPY